MSFAGGVVDLANAGFEEDRGNCPFCGAAPDDFHDPGCGLKPAQRIFGCETCHDSGEIEVMTSHLGPDDYAESISCPDCDMVSKAFQLIARLDLRWDGKHCKIESPLFGELKDTLRLLAGLASK